MHRPAADMDYTTQGWLMVDLKLIIWITPTAMSLVINNFGWIWLMVDLKVIGHD
jgi:hypothetical protein